jgi:hypothetical protein
MILGWDPVYTLDYVCRKIGIDDRSLYFAIFEKQNLKILALGFFFCFLQKIGDKEKKVASWLTDAA